MTVPSAASSSINDAFLNILATISLQQSDVDAFVRHETRVCSSIRAAFHVAKFARIGSLVRGSAIRGKSDLDLLVVFKRAEVTWGQSTVAPATLLERVRSALKQTFPNTELGRDGQAVVVRYADGRSIDVVPGWYFGPISQGNGWPLYQIPSGGRDWLPTAPDYHNAYIARGDVSAGGQLNAVVRVMKYWRQTRNSDLPLSPFHLEMLLTNWGTCNGGRSLSSYVAAALELLSQRECRALQDPCGISGYIHAAGSDSKRERLVQAVNASAKWAHEAVRSEALGRLTDAQYYWGLVFNGAFP